MSNREKLAEQLGVTRGLVIAASMIVRTWGEEVQAEEILGAAGVLTLDALELLGLEEFDIEPLRPVVETIEGRIRRRARG